MLAIAISVNVMWLPLIIAFSAFAGFFLRSAQIKKSTKRILSLENEMLKNHAEILKLNKELVELGNAIPNKTRIVSMKENQPAEEKEGTDPLKIKTVK
ncbi:MAG: hypothetical protein WKF97_09830 [Chitinophagaceae bacterium]